VSGAGEVPLPARQGPLRREGNPPPALGLRSAARRSGAAGGRGGPGGRRWARLSGTGAAGACSSGRSKPLNRRNREKGPSSDTVGASRLTCRRVAAVPSPARLPLLLGLIEKVRVGLERVVLSLTCKQPPRPRCLSPAQSLSAQ